MYPISCTRNSCLQEIKLDLEHPEVTLDLQSSQQEGGGAYGQKNPPFKNKSNWKWDLRVVPAGPWVVEPGRFGAASLPGWSQGSYPRLGSANPKARQEPSLPSLQAAGAVQHILDGLSQQFHSMLELITPQGPGD